MNDMFLILLLSSCNNSQLCDSENDVALGYLPLPSEIYTSFSDFDNRGKKFKKSKILSVEFSDGNIMTIRIADENDKVWRLTYLVTEY